MIDNNVSSLNFPKLILEKSGLYKLDWSDKDSKVNDHFGCIENPELSNELESRLNSLRFSIDKYYLKHIREYAKLASDEWGKNLSFDTLVRDHCLEVSQTAVKTSFYLLSDCLNTKNIDIINDLYLYQSIMLYRFWIGQTGGGLYVRNALIDNLCLDSKYGDIPLRKKFILYCLKDRSEMTKNIGNKKFLGFEKIPDKYIMDQALK